MKIKDCYIGQHVGFNYGGHKYIGCVSSISGNIITFIDDGKKQEVNVKYLIGVLK